MFRFPTSPFDKVKARSLLAHLAHPQMGELPLSAADRRKTEQWAIAANLLGDRGLTPEGNLVATKDPYLETTVTDWLIHFYLSLNDRSLWHYFVYEFLPNHSSFTQEELVNHCLEIFPIESPDKLKKSVRLILRTYTESEAIAKNKFLIQQKKHYLTGNSELLNPYTVGYCLAKVWENNFKAKTSILVDEILDEEIGLNLVLGINQEFLRQQLDILEKHEIIEQRSAKPHLSGTKTPIKDDNELSYQIYRCWNSPTEILEKAYENDIATPNRPLVQSLGDVLDDEDTVDFSQFLEWASGLIVVDGGSKMITRLAS